MKYYKLFFLLVFSSHLYSADSDSKLEYGKWLDKDGDIIPGPKIKNFIDDDGDGIDDRLQFGPGQPRAPGSSKDQEPKPKPEEPVKPTRPVLEKPSRVFPKRETPSDIAEVINSQKLIRSLIRNGMKNAIKGLGDDPERSEIKLALDKFKEQNKHLIDQQTENTKRINEWRKVNVPRRPDIPKQTNTEVIDQLKELRLKFIDDIKNAKQEDKPQIVAEYKENSKKLLNKLKEKARKRRGQ